MNKEIAEDTTQPLAETNDDQTLKLGDGLEDQTLKLGDGFDEALIGATIVAVRRTPSDLLDANPRPELSCVR